MDLEKRARPWTAADGDIPMEWAQGAMYGGPVVASRIEELVGRVSLFTTEGTTVLRLWDPEHETLDIRAALAGISERSYAVALSPVSRTPVESGYLECMHLTFASDGVAAADAITAFARRQQDRYGAM